MREDGRSDPSSRSRDSPLDCAVSPGLRLDRLVVFLIALLAASMTRAQSSGVNPDLSAVASFLFCPQGEEDCAYDEAGGELNFEELELGLQGYLNPYVRGEVFVALHEHEEELEVEVEEAYAHFVRGLGPFQVRLGKYLVDWGSVNPLHAHAYSWIFRPLVEERLFGEDGLNQIGLNANVSVPTGERGELKLSANVLRGDLVEQLEPGDGTDAPAGEDAGTGEDPAYHLRFSWSTPVGANQTLLLGANGLHGTIDPVLNRRVSWYGGDLKYRWRPDKYRSLNLLAAWIWSEADLTAEDGGGGRVATMGGYAIADWQFATRWNAGVKLDRSEGLETTDAIRRAEGFVNYRIMEESTLFRLLYRHEDGDVYPSAVNTTAVQLVFSLGPHRPHTF